MRTKLMAQHVQEPLFTNYFGSGILLFLLDLNIETLWLLEGGKIEK